MITQKDIDEAWEAWDKTWDEAVKAGVKARKAWDEDIDKAQEKAMKMARKFREQKVKDGM